MLQIDKEEQKRFFDVGYQVGTTDPTTKYYSALRASKEFYKSYLTPLCPGKSVLEYGCGMDSSARFFAEHGARYTAIDISDVAVELSRTSAEAAGIRDAEFLVRDAEATAFPDNHFDIVCGWGILHHLCLEKAIPEMRRILRPDGLAIFIEPLGHNPAINAFRKWTPGLRTHDEHPLTWSELEWLKGEFHENRYEFFHLCTLLGVPFRKAPGYPRLAQALGSVDQALFRRIPASRAMAWQVVMILQAPCKS